MDNDLKSVIEMDPKTITEEEVEISEELENRHKEVGCDKVVLLMRELSFRHEDEEYIKPEHFFQKEPSTSQGIGVSSPKAKKNTNEEKPKEVHYCLCSMPTDEEIAAMSEDEFMNFLLDAAVFFPEDMRCKLLPYTFDNLKSLTSRILLKMVAQLLGDCEADKKLAVLCGLKHCRRTTKISNHMHNINQTRQESESQSVLEDSASSNDSMEVISPSEDRIDVPMPKKAAENSVVYNSHTCAKICAVNCAKIFLEALQNNTIIPSIPNIPNMTAKDVASLSAQLVTKLSAPKAADSAETGDEDEKMVKMTVEDVAAVSCDLLSQLGINVPGDSINLIDITDVGVNSITTQLVSKLQGLVAEDDAANADTMSVGGAPKRAGIFNLSGARAPNSTSGGEKLNDDGGSCNIDDTSGNSNGAAYNTGKKQTPPHPLLSRKETDRLTAAIISRFIDQYSVKLSAKLSSSVSGKYCGTTYIEIEALNISAAKHADISDAVTEDDTIPYPFDIHDFPNKPMVTARRVVRLSKRRLEQNGHLNELLARLQEKYPKPKPRKIFGTLMGIKQGRKPLKLQDVRLVTEGFVPHRIAKLAVTRVTYQVEDVCDYIFEELGS
ncbi:uncharacterized protein [Drosophila bipectinata]|uniref:uncharacterized protein n=1 Tax=Drosophila bipectinata TaxID=42026 RepID=UPI001C8AD046|nr:uncharacterized protein LOC108133598 [Drosophila bipectinata]